MARKRLIRDKGDVREFPRYSIAEAAFYIRLPGSTLNAWTRGQDYVTARGIHRTFYPLIELADPEKQTPVVLQSCRSPHSSFYNRKGCPAQKR